MNNNFNKFSGNNIHRGFSPYGGRSSLNNLEAEKEAALAFAKKLQDKHLQDLKNSNLSNNVKKDVQHQKELDKEYEKRKAERIEKIKNISNEEIQKNIEIAKQQNEKFKNSFNENSSLDDLFDTLSNDLKSY